MNWTEIGYSIIFFVFGLAFEKMYKTLNRIEATLVESHLAMKISLIVGMLDTIKLRLSEIEETLKDRK